MCVCVCMCVCIVSLCMVVIWAYGRGAPAFTSVCVLLCRKFASVHCVSVYVRQ
jgi:hypothetical protein